MKVLIDNYTFNKTSKQVTFTDYTSIELERILLITNSTDNIIMFNFAVPGSGGTVAGNVLTLQYDTSSMDDNDKLQIFYEDEKIPASEELLQLLKDQIDNDTLLGRQLFQLLKPLGNIATATGSIKVAVDTGLAVSFVANQDLRTLTTVSSVTNQVNMGGIGAQDLQYNNAQAAWQLGIRSKLTF